MLKLPPLEFAEMLANRAGDYQAQQEQLMDQLKINILVPTRTGNH
jgi:hypothetical protein